ncbi:MAG: hypothetical protein JSU09_08760 [Bacteroidetes bacterium]|nr:hypothetical protein [Bacteroidota bacterium]
MKLSFALLVLVCANTFGQNENFLHKRYIVERLADLNSLQTGSIPNLPSAPPGLQGDVYLTPHFQESSFTLFKEEQKVSGFFSKLDLQRHEFNLITPQGVRVLNGDLVRSVVSLDSLTKIPHYYFNGKSFKSAAGIPSVGFYELLVEGEIPLLKKTELEFLKANFNPALNVGSKDHKYLKNHFFYYLKNGLIYPISKKNFFTIFGDRQKEMEAFGKSKKLKAENDLISIFEYYNKLVTREN